MIPEVVAGRGSTFHCRLLADSGVACQPAITVLALSG
jgi:hypothetical protein